MTRRENEASPDDRLVDWCLRGSWGAGVGRNSYDDCEDAVMSKREDVMLRLAAGESPRDVAQKLGVNETWVASLARDVRAAKRGGHTRANRWFSGEYEVDMEGCEELFDALPRPVQNWLLNILPKGGKMTDLLRDVLVTVHGEVAQ